MNRLQNAMLTAAVLGLGLGGPVAAEDDLVRTDVGIPYRSGDYVSVEAEPDNPLTEIISGYYFRTTETRAQQDDDFENAAFIFVDYGAELWDTADGSENKACAECHADAADTMADVAASHPKWAPKHNQPFAVEHRVNNCRTEHMGAEPWKWESREMLSMVSYVKSQGRGQPVNIDLEAGDMQSWWERGEEFYYTRVGQLDMACATCHETNYGNFIRADMLSQGHSNGFPTYRLKWQGLGSLHRRFRGCMNNIRAKPYKRGSDEYTALEVYLAWRGKGLPVESPSVRQ